MKPWPMPRWPMRSTSYFPFFLDSLRGTGGVGAAITGGLAGATEASEAAARVGAMASTARDTQRVSRARRISFNFRDTSGREGRTWSPQRSGRLSLHRNKKKGSKKEKIRRRAIAAKGLMGADSDESVWGGAGMLRLRATIALLSSRCAQHDRGFVVVPPRFAWAGHPEAAVSTSIVHLIPEPRSSRYFA